MGKPGTQSGAIERRYSGKSRVPVDRRLAKLLLQEAQIRRDFGEEGVKRFWEEVEKLDTAPPKGEK
jgi:hypothetical protein